MSEQKQPLLQVKHLTKHFKTRQKNQVVVAVNDVSIDFERGKTLGLIGESGSGKTTIGRCILRLTEPTDGEVIFNGTDVIKLKEKEFAKNWRPKMQLVFQDPFDSLDPRMTIKQIILEPIILAGALGDRNPDIVVKDLLKKVKLDLFPMIFQRFLVLNISLKNKYHQNHYQFQLYLKTEMLVK